ncbi:MAG: cell division protein FtsW [Eubacterium sp.]|nr:cell division protein FtsW [Eubacterium sp.]
MSDRLEPPKPKRSREAEAAPTAEIIKKPKGKWQLFGLDVFTIGGIDLIFFGIVIALLTIGLIMLFSATYPYALYKYGDSYYFIKRQVAFSVGGVVVMLLISKLNYRLLLKFKWVIFAVTVGLLGLVLVYHTNVPGGFRRWMQLGPITIQPSDIAKFCLVLILADYISKNYKQMHKPIQGIVYPVLITALFAGLVFLEHHNSGTLLLFTIGAVMMFSGGSNGKLFAIGFAIAIAAIIFIIFNPNVMMEYAGERIVAWLDKDYDPLGARWQTNNSLYAIGSGGLWGAGLGNSRQKFLYVSEPQNDFIFSIVCEELGFIRSSLIIALFGALFVRGIKIATHTGDRFGSFLVIGIVSQVAIQTILNILVVTDWFPNTGISLPFFSYGGTAILMLLGEMGIVLSVSRKSNQKKV